MEEIDKNCKKDDCGVMATFDQDASNSSNVEVRLDYYGLIQDILEVNYRKVSHFILDIHGSKSSSGEEMPLYAVINVEFMLLTPRPFGETKMTRLFFPINVSRYILKIQAQLAIFVNINNVHFLYVLCKVVFYPTCSNPS